MSIPFNRLTRRGFLQTSAAAVSLAALPHWSAAQEKKDEFGGFALGIQSYTFRNFDLEPALKRTKELGLTHGVFYSKHLANNATAAQVTAFLKLCKEYDVSVDCYGVHPNVTLDLGGLRAAVLGVFAERDAFVPPNGWRQAARLPNTVATTPRITWRWLRRPSRSCAARSRKSGSTGWNASRITCGPP